MDMEEDMAMAQFSSRMMGARVKLAYAITVRHEIATVRTHQRFHGSVSTVSMQCYCAACAKTE
jgi:hypothetical protein